MEYFCYYIGLCFYPIFISLLLAILNGTEDEKNNAFIDTRFDEL